MPSIVVLVINIVSCKRYGMFRSILIHLIVTGSHMVDDIMKSFVTTYRRTRIEMKKPLTGNHNTIFVSPLGYYPKLESF